MGPLIPPGRFLREAEILDLVKGSTPCLGLVLMRGTLDNATCLAGILKEEVADNPYATLVTQRECEERVIGKKIMQTSIAKITEQDPFLP